MKNLTAFFKLLTMTIPKLSTTNNIMPLKPFSRLLTIFGLTIMFTGSGWGANECQWNDFDISWSNNSYTENGSTDNDTGDNDRFYGTAPSAGTITASVTNNDVYLTASATTECPSSSGTLSTTTFTVTTGQGFNVNVFTPNNNTEQYTLTITFTPDSSGGGGNVTTPVCTESGATKAYRDFCMRTKLTFPGNMVTIGNTILVAPDTNNGNDDSSNSDICDSYVDGSYIDNATATNDNYYLCHYRNDPLNDDGGPSTSATVSSGTVNDHIPDPANSELKWAGLYWQAIVHDEDVTNMQIKIKNGNDPYVTIGYDKLDYIDSSYGSDNDSYSAFKDVTSILQNNGWLTGEFTVAGIPVGEDNVFGGLGAYGAWTLVLIYKNDREKLRNFTVFDGWTQITSSTDAIINVAGFYTPKQGDISSVASIFAAEGDRHWFGDDLIATSQAGVETTLTNDYVTGDTQAVWSAIYPEFTRTPNPTNNQGIDIQSFDLGTNGFNVLRHTDSQVSFKFTSNIDVYWPSMIAFNTELYAPDFCYDYAYKQNDLYFTEDNNGSYAPRIVGDGLSSDDITVELFIRNEEESDTNATNMVMHITDINTSQATYVPSSAYVTLPGEVYPVAATPNPLQEFNIGTIGGKEHFSVDYNLSLTGSSIDMPIKANIEYTLVLADSSGNPVPIDFNTSISEAIPLCTEENFSYYPEYDIFNVEHSALFSSQKYNLPTQTARRVGDFKVVSYDKDNVHSRSGVSTPVGIEIIDANKYHDIKASCVETDSALTPRIWLTFDDNTTNIELDKVAIQAAIDAPATSDIILDPTNALYEPEDYFTFVRENTAFRIVYPRAEDGELLDLNKTNCIGQQKEPCYLVNGFPDMVQWNLGSGPGKCVQDVQTGQDTIAQHCGNNGTKGVDRAQLALCMECIYGYNLTYVCSRDNFALRPESFRIALNDQEQNTTVTPIPKQLISFNNDPSKSHGGGNGDRIVAGYNYRVEINATNHQNDNATPGYRVSFPEDGMDGQRLFSMKWWEFSNDDTYCNDVSDHNKSINFNFLGEAEGNLSNNEIGKYDLNLYDKIWTRVDWDSNYMGHHLTYSNYFLGGNDCAVGSAVPQQSSTITSYTDDMSGCDINTTNHTNSDDNNLVYTDIPLYIFPYTFNHDGVIPAIGPYIRTHDQEFVYIDTPPTADVNDTEMSYNMNGRFFATGYDDDIRLSNFVTGCYADDVNMDLTFTYNIPEPTITPYLSYNLKDYNTTDSTVIYRPDSGTDDFEVGHHNSSTTPFIIMQDEKYFAKDMNGSIIMDLGYNFVRAYNQPLNPRYITFHDFNLTYNVNPADIKADLESDFQIFGNKDLDHNVTFVYGRAKPSQYFYDDVVTDNIDTPNSIVVYCDRDPIECSSIYNIETVLSKTEEFDWYLSRGHVTIPDNDGNITLLASTGGSVTNDDPVTINNSGGINNPNVNVSANTGTDRPLDVFINFGNDTNRWLIYNPYLDAIPSPYYRVRFIGQSDWAGAGDTGHTVDGDTSIQKNRRLGW